MPNATKSKSSSKPKRAASSRSVARPMSGAKKTKRATAPAPRVGAKKTAKTAARSKKRAPAKRAKATKTGARKRSARGRGPSARPSEPMFGMDRERESEG